MEEMLPFVFWRVRFAVGPVSAVVAGVAGAGMDLLRRLRFVGGSVIGSLSSSVVGVESDVAAGTRTASQVRVALFLVVLLGALFEAAVGGGGVVGSSR